MEILTEATLRSACPTGECEYTYPPGVFVTESALQYAKERNIHLAQSDYAAMTWTKTPAGAAASKKPEAMTHIRAGELVDKTDPRIAFRGKLDSFQAELLCLAAEAHSAGDETLVCALSEVLQLCRNILAAEVKQTPLPEWTLFSLSPEELHQASHKSPHPVPDYRMGKTAMALNRLRALSRELELSWLCAYAPDARSDIVLALNRLSSALYLLFRKEVNQHG